MPRKCCAGECRSNYDGELESVTCFGFPKDRLKRDAWRTALNVVLEESEITKYMGVCIKHWPKGFETYSKKGWDLPVHPPSVFESSPSCSGQTVSEDRKVSKRKVDYDSRRESAEKRKKDKDKFYNWSEIVKYGRSKAGLAFSDSDNGFYLIRFDGNPPTIKFSIEITRDLKISCYKKSSKMPVREELGFAAKFERFSQLDNIIEKAETWKIDIHSELKLRSQEFSSLINDSTDDIGDDVRHKIQFLSEQFYLLSTEPSGRRYKPETVRDSLDLFLRSRNCYSATRNILTLPNPKMLKSYFGHFGSEGSVQECTATVKSVFENLSSKQLYCKVLFDEIHIKPSIRYRGNHIIGKSVDQPEKAAKTILALMVCCSMGGPTFVARLIPVHSLNHAFLSEQLEKLLHIIHDCGGFVFLCMSDNLRCNQSTFNDSHKKYGTVKEWFINHPIPNSEFIFLFLLYDPTHLLKNIRNNWVTEKTQTLRFTDPDTGKTVEARWRDLIEIYKEESETTIKKTKLDYSTLYPSNFEKQKVHLAWNIFNEKTSAELLCRGKTDTAVFVEAVTKLWNILNIKNPNKDKRLNDPHRRKFETPNDPRLEYLRKMANSFKEMDTSSTGYKHRIKSLTGDTSNALFVTLNGLADLIPTLLAKGFHYVLPGEFQSDPIEGEFGIYRQQSGGNFYISVDQVLSSLHLQRLKLFKILSIEPTNVHDNESCCQTSLDGTELDCLDNCFEMSSKLTESEKSTLYYICGYITHKEGFVPLEIVTPEVCAPDYIKPS